MKKKRNGKFFEQQKELFKKFNARRQRGGKVTYVWLKKKMKILCKKAKPDGFDEKKHKFTNRWCRAYCKRWRISSQRKMNKKHKSALENSLSCELSVLHYLLGRPKHRICRRMKKLKLYFSYGF